MDFGNNKSKSWISIIRHIFTKDVGISNSTVNSNLELTKTNSSLEYLTKNSTPKSIKVDFKLFMVESSWADSNLKSMCRSRFHPKIYRGKFWCRSNHDRLCFHPNQRTNAGRT